MRIFFLIFSFFAFPAYAAPVVFDVVPSESSIRFEVMQGTAKISGQFAVFTAQIAFHPEALAASKAVVTVDMASVTASDDEAQAMLAKEEWLNPKAFPQAIFTSESFKSLGDKHYEALGKLTLKGMVMPVVLSFTLDAFSPTAAAITGEMTLHRKDFHIGWDDTTSVADEVKLLVAVKAIAK